MSPHYTMACGDVRGRVTDGAGSSVAVEWPDPERPVAIRPQSGGCACVHETGWLSPLQMAKRSQSGRREEIKGEMKGGTQRRMAMAFRWVRLERPLCSAAWTRRVRFPGVRALGGSSARRLGGLTGRQLTSPVAEAPEVDLRRSARSDRETELAARSPGGADANSSYSTTEVSVKKSYSKTTRPRPGVCAPSLAGCFFPPGAGGCLPNRHGVGGFPTKLIHPSLSERRARPPRQQRAAAPR